MTDIDNAAAGGIPIGTNRITDDQQSLTWSRVTLSLNSRLPPPRSGAASVVVRGQLFMFGVSSEMLFRLISNSLKELSMRLKGSRK